MLHWLVDHATIVYVLLGFLGLAFGVGWWTTRDRRYAISFGAVACLIFGIWLLSAFTVTDAKLVQRTLQQMSNAVAARRPEVILANVSDHFELNQQGKAFFRELVERYVTSGQVDSIWVSDFEVRELSRAERKATVLFNVGGTGPAIEGSGFYRCEAKFALEQDDRWRLLSFRLAIPPLDPAKGQNVELPFGR
jgi:hypothetical protein